MIWRLIFVGLLLFSPIIIHYFKFNHSGTVVFEMFGGSFRANGFALSLILGLFYLFLRLFLNLVDLPKTLTRYYKDQHREKGIKSLFEAFIARILDDRDMLRSAVEDLRRYWGRNPIQKYYLARLAQVSHNEHDYQKHVSDLIQDPKGAILGNFLRAEDLLKQKHFESAYQALKCMLEDNPYSGWIMENLFQCACQLSKFDEAQNYLDRMYRFQLFEREKLNRFEAYMLCLRAKSLPQPEALKLYKKAIELNPDHYEAAIQAALLSKTLGKVSKCREIIEKTWVRKPPFKVAEELAEIYVSTFPIHSEVEKLDYLQKLKALVPDYEEQARVEAHFAIKAHLWGRARKALSLVEKNKRAEDYMLLAEIEAAEGQSQKQLQCLEKALKVMLDSK